MSKTLGFDEPFVWTEADIAKIVDGASARRVFGTPRNPRTEMVHFNGVVERDPLNFGGALVWCREPGRADPYRLIALGTIDPSTLLLHYSVPSIETGRLSSGPVESVPDGFDVPFAWAEADFARATPGATVHAISGTPELPHTRVLKLTGKVTRGPEWFGGGLVTCFNTNRPALKFDVAVGTIDPRNMHGGRPRLTGDAHVERAAKMYGVPPEEVTPEMRMDAKERAFIENYRGTWRTTLGRFKCREPQPQNIPITPVSPPAWKPLPISSHLGLIDLKEAGERLAISMTPFPGDRFETLGELSRRFIGGEFDGPVEPWLETLRAVPPSAVRLVDEETADAADALLPTAPGGMRDALEKGVEMHKAYMERLAKQPGGARWTAHEWTLKQRQGIVAGATAVIDGKRRVLNGNLSNFRSVEYHIEQDGVIVATNSALLISIDPATLEPPVTIRPCFYESTDEVDTANALILGAVPASVITARLTPPPCCKQKAKYGDSHSLECVNRGATHVKPEATQTSAVDNVLERGAVLYNEAEDTQLIAPDEGRAIWGAGWRKPR